MDKENRHELRLEVQKKLKFIKMNLNFLSDENLSEFEKDLDKIIKNLVQDLD
jgi:hypothetical protein